MMKAQKSLRRAGVLGSVVLGLYAALPARAARAQDPVAPPAAPGDAAAPPAPEAAPASDTQLPQPGEPLPTPAPAEAAAAAAPSAEATSDADAAAVAALVGELSSGSDSEGADVGLDDPVFSLYGFADFAYFTQLGERRVVSNQHGTFMVGNFNVYLSTEWERHWRSLGEVRFMYAPNGAYLTGNQYGQQTAERGDTNVLDGTDLNHPVRWGGVSIQRIWLEYNFDNYLTLRAGQWLTPYGIWNVDHGSPTIVGIYKPYIINQDWFPERQTGIEAYGHVYLGDTQLGYHLTLSNGRGPIDSYRDLDGNMGVGARAYLRNDTLLGTITLGVSGYGGRYTDRPGNGVAVDEGKLVINDPPTDRYDEVAFAADLKWEWGGLLVQSEAILHDKRYQDPFRPTVQPLGPGAPGFAPDARTWGMYGLVGYRLPWLNIMPFAMMQYVGTEPSDAHEYSVGLNLRPSPRVALKAEYKYVIIDSPPGIELGNLNLFGMQLAWNF